MSRRKYVVGNWKMHGVGSDIAEIQAIASSTRRYPEVDVALCVPATLIERAARAVPGFPIGAQDVHHAERGAHTGCVCTAMLLDCGASLTIVGHSERRAAQREANHEVRSKAQAALNAGVDVVLCVGESLDVRERGEAVAFVEQQLLASLPAELADAGRFAVSYEPIWAIGTGRVASTDDIAEMVACIRGRLEAVYGTKAEAIRTLYGGSVSPSNAADIFALGDVDGALVGGASLKAADFLPIVEAAARATKQSTAA